LWWLSILALIALIPVFVAGVALVVYLVLPPAPLDIVVLGLDARTGEGYESRTDSIMIMGVNPSRLQVSLMSIPRDLFIDTPGYGLLRVNTINREAELVAPGSGPALVKAALATSFPMEPDRYVRVNFDAFMGLIDALGGIDIEVPRHLIDTQYPDGLDVRTVEFQQGWQHMDGETALAYARTRHPDDDYQRASRQQQVVQATFQALVSPANWLRLPQVMQVFSDSVDTDMTVLDMLVAAPPLILDGGLGEIDQLVIDRDLIALTADGLVVPNYSLVNPWVEDHFD
jgi:LCP family protein required for cell wall assembly